MIAKTQQKTGSQVDDYNLLHLSNKFDYLSNGRAKTGYHTLKDRQFAQKDNVVSISYMEALEAFKTTDNAEDFIKKAVPHLFC